MLKYQPENREAEERRAQTTQLPLEALRGSATSLSPETGHQVRAELEAQDRPKHGWRTPALISRLVPASQWTTGQEGCKEGTGLKPGGSENNGAPQGAGLGGKAGVGGWDSEGQQEAAKSWRKPKQRSGMFPGLLGQKPVVCQGDEVAKGGGVWQGEWHCWSLRFRSESSWQEGWAPTLPVQEF